MTTPIHSSLPVNRAAPAHVTGPILPLPHACQRLTRALGEGSLEESRGAAAMLRQTFEAFQQDPDSWRAVAPEAVVENNVDLLMSVVCCLHREELYDWVNGELQPQLDKWVDQLEQGLSITLEMIPEVRRADFLMRIAARSRAAVDAVLEHAAQGQAAASALAHPAAMGTVITGLRGLQGVIKALRVQIKLVSAQQVEGRTATAQYFRKLSAMVTIAFITLMLVRISAVVLGGVLLAQPPSDEGINGLSVSRFALNTTNLATTVFYERIRERRTDVLTKRAELSRERAELKKVLFRAQDWTTALQTLQAMGQDAAGGRALAPAKLTAGFTALERIQNGSPQDSAGGGGGGFSSSLEGSAEEARARLRSTGVSVEIAFDPRDRLRPEEFEQQAKVLAEAMERLLDPMRDVMQACAWVCEGIPIGAESTPAAIGAVASILERHLVMLSEHRAYGSDLAEAGQRLLRDALEIQRSCCGSDRSRTTQLLTQLLDYGFAASAWLSGGVEAFAGLDGDRSKQILFATAIIDALNSGTAPLRELFFNRAETYQRMVLQLSQAVAAVEGILPLAESAHRAFRHITEALRVAADAQAPEESSQELVERAHQSVLIAQEIGHLALLLSQCSAADPAREPLMQRIHTMMQMLDRLSEPSARPMARGLANSAAQSRWASGEDSAETTSLTQALAEAVLLPEERGAGLGERPMPNLVAQLRRATQRAEQGIQAAHGSRARQTSPTSSPAGTLSSSSRPGHEGSEPLQRHAFSASARVVEEVSIRIDAPAARPLESPTASATPSAPARVGDSRAAQLWGLVRRSYRLLAAEAFLERGRWKDPVLPGKEGLRLAGLLRAALVVSSSRVLHRFQAVAATSPVPRMPVAGRRLTPTRGSVRSGSSPSGSFEVTQLGEPTMWV